LKTLNSESIESSLFTTVLNPGFFWEDSSISNGRLRSEELTLSLHQA
jgi:hypothetical protein